MTEEELDVFFLETMQAIKEELKNCYEYTKDLNTPEYQEINEDYEASLIELDNLLKTCTTIDELSEKDDETIDSVYNYIAEYADNYTISAQEPERTMNLNTYTKLEELLDLFIDDESCEDEDSE